MHTTNSEECAQRALYYAEQFTIARTNSRRGHDDRREFWRNQAKRYEEMVGVWMALAKQRRV